MDLRKILVSWFEEQDFVRDDYFWRPKTWNFFDFDKIGGVTKNNVPFLLMFDNEKAEIIIGLGPVIEPETKKWDGDMWHKGADTILSLYNPDCFGLLNDYLNSLSI